MDLDMSFLENASSLFSSISIYLFGGIVAFDQVFVNGHDDLDLLVQLTFFSKTVQTH